MLAATWIRGGKVLEAERLPAICSSLFVFSSRKGGGKRREKEREGRKRRGPLLRCPLAAQEAGGEILLTTNRLSPGISGNAKVHTGAAGSREGRARQALPSPAPCHPGGCGEARGSRNRCGDSTRPRLPSSSAPSTWGPPRGETRAPAGLATIPRVAPARRAPPRPRCRPALYSAPRLQLPPGPCAGHRCRPRPARSGAGRPQGALAFPDPRSGRPYRLRVRAETVLCAGTCRGVFAVRSQMFFHI